MAVEETRWVVPELVKTITIAVLGRPGWESLLWLRPRTDSKHSCSAAGATFQTASLTGPSGTQISWVKSVNLFIRDPGPVC